MVELTRFLGKAEFLWKKSGPVPGWILRGLGGHLPPIRKLQVVVKRRVTKSFNRATVY